MWGERGSNCPCLVLKDMVWGVISSMSPDFVLVGCGGCGRCPLARGEQLAGGPRARFAVAGNTIEEYGWVRQCDMVWRCVSRTVQVKGWEGGDGRGRMG